MSNTRTSMVFFMGTERDGAGMPKPFYNYQLYAADVGGKGGLSAVATIWSPTGGAITAGQPKHFPLTEGSAEDAQAAAIEWLRAHPLHRGLQSIG